MAGLRAFSGRLLRRGPAPPPVVPAGAAPPEGRAGVYLDGGFGVGKTHLLASLWHTAPAPRRSGRSWSTRTWWGRWGSRGQRGALAEHELVCIDEFELDDPGDTVLMSTLLELADGAGVRTGGDVQHAA